MDDRRDEPLSAGEDAPGREGKNRPGSWTKNHGWLEKPGETTVVDRVAERLDPVEPSDAWYRPVMASTAPVRPPGYDIGIPTLMMVLSVTLFFWAPIMNAFIGGCLGGWRARSMGRAMAAVGLTLLIGIPLLLATQAMSVGFQPLYGLGFGGYLLTTALSLLLGAWTGASTRWAIREEQGPLRRWVEGPWGTPRRRDWSRG